MNYENGKTPWASQPLTAVQEAQKTIDADRIHRNLQGDQLLLLSSVMPSFRAQVRQLAQGLYGWFQHQGFWPAGHMDDMDDEYARLKKTEKLALIGTEVSEAVEAVRKGDHVNEAEELADILVRVLDYAGGFNIDLGSAFEAKMVANYKRPFRHNKKF